MQSIKTHFLNSKKAYLLALAVLSVILPDLAFASTGGGGLPWDDPIQTITDSFTGPVAYGISIMCLIASFGSLAFGGELNDTTRKVFMVVLIISGLVFAAQLLTSLFGVSGAVI